MIPTTLAERVKEALRPLKLDIAKLARLWGVDRSGLSERLNSGRIDDEELAKVSELTGANLPWLRYGVLGDYDQGFRAAVEKMHEMLGRLSPEPPPPATLLGPEDIPSVPPPTTPATPARPPAPPKRRRPKGR